jgi:hypothetical protein
VLSVDAALAQTGLALGLLRPALKFAAVVKGDVGGGGGHGGIITVSDGRVAPKCDICQLTWMVVFAIVVGKVVERDKPLNIYMRRLTAFP